jgi:hypothetical protein
MLIQICNLNVWKLGIYNPRQKKSGLQILTSKGKQIHHAHSDLPTWNERSIWTGNPKDSLDKKIKNKKNKHHA